jgi:transcriptional regulator with XRE-family HTH domain
VSRDYGEVVSVGDLIREHRERAGLSQAELALKVGKTDGAVSQWETGRTIPRRDVAFRIDQVLGAAGQIAAAMGYQLPTDAPSVAIVVERLVEQVTKHEARIADLEALVEAVTERLRAVTERAIRSDTDGTPRPVGRSGRPVDRRR